tara:strand:- start:868 stop:1305 length:438 start_codon:yes stop_codon:yes gene_type:complete
MPETTDGKKFDYSKLGMMKAKMHQQRLDKNKKSMGKKIAIATASVPVYAYTAHKVIDAVNNPAKKAFQVLEKQRQAKITPSFNYSGPLTEYQRSLHTTTPGYRGGKPTASGKKFLKSGGGGGGIYNVAQPVADKNIMNKYGKKLK